MKGKTLNEFIETLYSGMEIEFLYDDKYYIIQGDSNNGHQITIDELAYDKNKNYDEYEFYSLCIKGCSFEECVNRLLETKLIDDKTLYELEEDIIVLYG